MNSQKSLRVLMVHIDPCIRVLKEIKALLAHGISIDLLCNGLTHHPSIEEFVGTVYYYDDVRSLESFLRKKHTCWDVIHCHNEPNYITAVAIDACPQRPVVYDCHDLSSARTTLSSAEADIEQYCFTNSAAVIHVSEGLKQFAFKKFGPSLSIVLPSFPLAEEAKIDVKPKLLGNHVVYQGGIVNTTVTQFSYRFYIPMFEHLVKHDLHVHVFPPRNVAEEVLAPYQKLDKIYAKFHLHTSLPYTELIKTMSQFQWGFSGFNFDHIQKTTAVNFLDNALPNKFFDYLLAGVCPVVINNKTAATFAKKHGVGFAAENMDDFVRICTTQSPLPALKNFDIIDMQTQIVKLLALYDAVITQYKTHSHRKNMTNYSDMQKFAYADEYFSDSSAIAYLGLRKSKKIRSSLDMLMQYYTSGVWLYKENDIYFSHTSADTHALYLMSFINLHEKCNSMADEVQCIAKKLLSLNNEKSGGNFGWGLGRARENKLQKKAGVPTLAPATTTYTYTSTLAGYALMGAWDILRDPDFLQACARWRQSFNAHIGLHDTNQCCLYADHISFKYPPIFIPNVTPLHMGFLAELARRDENIDDSSQVNSLYNAFCALRQCDNWQYDSGVQEDLLHLAMIVEGVGRAKNIIGSVSWAGNVIDNMIGMMFKNGSICESTNCWGSSNWGPGWALLAFQQYGVPRSYIDTAVDFLLKNPRRMLYNIRTASIYARFFSTIE